MVDFELVSSSGMVHSCQRHTVSNQVGLIQGAPQRLPVITLKTDFPILHGTTIEMSSCIGVDVAIAQSCRVCVHQHLEWFV